MIEDRNKTEIAKNTLVAELKFISKLRNGKISTKAVLVIGNLFVMLIQARPTEAK